MLFRLEETHGDLYRVAGALVALSVIGVSFPNQYRGLIQRVAECCLFAGLIYALIP